MLKFWDAETDAMLWTLRAHTPYVTGLHFEGQDIVTRGFGGDVARWSLPAPESVLASCHIDKVAMGSPDICLAR